jgi:glyoxylase-like metal-dependent hydrolase (beta-lactamase superfamily II)
MSSKYNIQLLKMGECEVAGPEVFWMSHWNDWVKLFFWMVVVRGNGKTAIINTGPPADLTELNERWSGGFGERGKLVRQESERPLNALASLDIRPEDVDYVLITPLQIYATANIQHFKNAEVCISKRGWIEDFHAEKFPMHVPRKLRVSDETLQYLVFEANHKLRLLEDEDEILPGLRCFWAGVHHRSSMCYVIDTANGRVAVSDCVFKYQNFEEGEPLGIQESLEEYYVTCARIRRASDIFIPLYEPDVLKRFPGGKIG